MYNKEPFINTTFFSYLLRYKLFFPFLKWCLFLSKSLFRTCLWSLTASVVSPLGSSASLSCLSPHQYFSTSVSVWRTALDVSQQFHGFSCVTNNNNQPKAPRYADQYFRSSRSFCSKCMIFCHSIDGKLLLLLPGSLWLPVPMLCHPGCLCTNWDFGQKEKKETFICVTGATKVCLQPIHLSCPCNNTLLTKLLHTGFSWVLQYLWTLGSPTGKCWNASV